MSSIFRKIAEKPIIFLLAVNIVAGMFVFGDYGLSWDEPLFYDYADALGYAYSPREWLSESFDLNNSFGASGDDHKTRGPAYLLLGRGPVYLVEALGFGQASAWHLINFLFFQLGIYFHYRLTLRWIRPSAALAAAALFSWQPLLWGHAFINPKDPPFLTFFLASVHFGFEMVDRLADRAKTPRERLSNVVLPSVALGITTSIRVLGPLAGLLVLLYATWRFGRRFLSLLPPLVLYALLAVATILITWPFLWEDPLTRFIEVFSFMSDNPTNLSVLFAGEVYRAGELPRRYLPFMLATTLTEPVWPLFLVGMLAGYWSLFRGDREHATRREEGEFSAGWNSLRASFDLSERLKKSVSLTLVLLWFAIVAGYVLFRKPAMYDGLRHFLFILPPIFIFTGLAFEFLAAKLPWCLYATLVLLVLLPGVAGLVRLHPYEYTYYNSYIGGTGQAFRQYETDYWLTCYKEAVETLNQTVPETIDLFVHRESYIAAYYAADNVRVYDLRGALDEVKPGDFVLINTRTNEDRRIFRDIPASVQIQRAGALFCVIKQVP